MSKLYIIAFGGILLIVSMLLLGGCDRDQIVSDGREAAVTFQLDLGDIIGEAGTKGKSDVSRAAVWPAEFPITVRVIRTSDQSEVGIHTLTVQRDTQDTTKYMATKAVSLPAEIDLRITVIAQIETETYLGQITLNLQRGESQTHTIMMDPATNTPPNQPSNPNPADNATAISINTNLSWTCSDPDGDPLTYDVYFGTSSNPPLVNSNLSGATYIPGALNSSTTYYWKINAEDDHGNSTSGNIWNFTTETTSVSLWIATIEYYPESANLDSIVTALYGSDYRVADWNDLVSYSQTYDIVAWADSIDMLNGYPYGFLVTCDGYHFWSSNRHYWIDRHDGVVPSGWLVHSTINNHFIDLGSWYNMMLRILCIRIY